MGFLQNHLGSDLSLSAMSGPYSPTDFASAYRVGSSISHQKAAAESATACTSPRNTGVSRANHRLWFMPRCPPLTDKNAADIIRSRIAHAEKYFSAPLSDPWPFSFDTLITAAQYATAGGDQTRTSAAGDEHRTSHIAAHRDILYRC